MPHGVSGLSVLNIRTHACQDFIVHKLNLKIAHSFYVYALKFTVPVTAKIPGKVSILVLKNIYITKLYCLIYEA